MIILGFALLSFIFAASLAASPSTPTTIIPTTTPTPTPTPCKCHVQNGLEPNLRDTGCESYKSCKDFRCTLAPCPDNFQFDFESRTCKPNSQVWCQFQFQKVEAALQEVRHQKQQKSANQEHYDYEEYDKNYDEAYDKNYNYQGDPKGSDDEEYYYYEDDSDYKPHEVPDYDHKGYMCETEWGHEPNLKDMECKSFWRCDEYEGSLIDCEHGLLYDYFAMACRHHTEVSCASQMHDFFKMQATKLAKKNRNKKGRRVRRRKGGKKGKKDKKEDEGPTLVHHFYHGNTHPRLDANDGSFDESARVRHVLVNPKTSEDTRMERMKTSETHQP